MELRPYQVQAVEALRNKIRIGRNRLVLVAPTGSGKTCIAAHIIQSATAKGTRTLFLAHRKELIDQASGKLEAFGVEHGIIMAGYPKRDASVQVASVQTAIRRTLPEGFNLVVVDEAHHGSADSYQRIISQFPAAKVVGLTATPFRADGRGLGVLFEDFVRVATVEELIGLGFLVPARVWAPTTIDMSGVRKVRGEFDETETAARANTATIVGGIVEHYQRLGNGELAICFAVSVEHSRAIVAQFLAHGIPAAHLDAETPREERARILADLAVGSVRVVSNCGILSEGYDNPAVSVCIQARPTASLGLHLQQVGRVLRPHPGKTIARVIDHAGNHSRHGFATDTHEVDLAEGVKGRKQQGGPSVKTCLECYALMPAGTTECPACGAEQAGPKPVEIQEGSLEEIAPESKRGPRPTEFLRSRMVIAAERGYKPGWAAWQFKAIFGRWPTKREKDAA